MFTADPQHIHTVLFTITLPSIQSLLLHAILFAMWYFSTMTAQFTLQQCLQHILNIYIRYCLQLHYTVYCLCYYICYTFHNMIFFHNYCTIHSTQCYSIFSTYTYSTVYNYTTQYTDCAVYICYPFHNVIFSTMTAQFTLQQCLQHILNIYIRYCLQLYYPVHWLCCLYMLPLHNVTFFHNYCTSDSITMSIAYPQHIHIVLFTTTLHSILTLLFIYASFTQCDIFSQLLHNWLYNNVYSISSTYTCGTVYNYTSQYADFSVYICFPFTMWIFFHSYCIIVYSTMFTVRLHWILTVLFTITLPSILSVLFT